MGSFSSGQTDVSERAEDSPEHRVGGAVARTGMRDPEVMEIDFVPDPALFPFDSHWYATSAGRMHYIDEGPRDAPVIVLFHGNPMWSFLYRHIIRGLRDSCWQCQPKLAPP
ncbi:MAG: hypothetical protein ACR2G2_13455 [Pseudonocardia sp.]